MSITSIEWTKRPGTIGETWNPTTGCNKVDRGCKNCYAEIMHKRLRAMGQEKYQAPFLDGAVAHRETLDIPLKWTKPRTVFVDSMSDLFHIAIKFDFLFNVFEVMRSTPQHTYLILTKRPERAIEFWKHMAFCVQDWECPPNVWMGTSANDQESADKRVPLLLELDGCLHFLSYEPATGPVDLTRIGTNECWCIDALRGVGYADGNVYNEGRLDWVIAGGESGPKAVPADPAWFVRVQSDCERAGVPFFFKQWGLWHPVTLPTDGSYTGTHVKGKDKGFNVLDGQIWQQFPTPKTTTHE